MVPQTEQDFDLSSNRDPGSDAQTALDHAVGRFEDQVTLNTVALVTVPAAVLTVIAHDLAPAGTLTTTDVADTVLIGAAVDPNNTLVVVPSACPLMVTVVPTGPAGGVKFLIVGVADVVIRPMELVN